MYSYREQLEVVTKLRVGDGQTLRCNCPFCGGKNTFGVTRVGRKLTWGCFRNSCTARGVRDGDQSREGVAKALSGLTDSSPIKNPIPTVLTSVRNQPMALLWLATVNSLKAYEQGLISIKYSPLEDRVMFPVAELGYTGRARKGINPKWKKYGVCDSLLTCGNGRIAVVVEDACSACAVGILPEFTGCALLGTKLSREQIMQLRTYDEVIVALDPDASMVALGMVKTLSGTMKARLGLIPDDLKNFGPEAIKQILMD